MSVCKKGDIQHTYSISVIFFQVRIGIQSLAELWKCTINGVTKQDSTEAVDTVDTPADTMDIGI